MPAIKGLKVTSNVTNPTGGADYVDLFYDLNFNMTTSQGDANSLNFHIPTAPYLNEQAFDEGKRTIDELSKIIVLNMTPAKLRGTSFRNDLYMKLKGALEAEGKTVNIVN